MWCSAQRRRATRASRRKRSGVSALEFAMVMPAFVLLIYAMVEFCRAMMVISLLNNASRAGCREAILPRASTTTINAAVDSLLSKQSISGYSAQVLVNGSTGSLANATAGDLITVQLSVPIERVSWMPGIKLVAGNLQGQYTLPKE